MKVFAIDLDGCAFENPEKVRELYENPSNVIIIHTSRSSSIRGHTEQELKSKKIPYHALVMDRLRADVYINDKNQGGLRWQLV